MMDSIEQKMHEALGAEKDALMVRLREAMFGPAQPIAKTDHTDREKLTADAPAAADKPKPTRWQDGALAEEHMRAPTLAEYIDATRDGRMFEVHLPGVGSVSLPYAGPLMTGDEVRFGIHGHDLRLSDFRVPRMPEVGSRWVSRDDESRTCRVISCADHKVEALTEKEHSLPRLRTFSVELFYELYRSAGASSTVGASAEHEQHASDDVKRAANSAPALTIHGMEDMAPLAQAEKMVLLLNIRPGDLVQQDTAIVAFLGLFGDTRHTLVEVARGHARRAGVASGHATMARWSEWETFRSRVDRLPPETARRTYSFNIVRRYGPTLAPAPACPKELSELVCEELVDVPDGWSREQWQAALLGMMEQAHPDRGLENYDNADKMREPVAEMRANREKAEEYDLNLANTPAQPRWWLGESAPKRERMGRRR